MQAVIVIRSVRDEVVTFLVMAPEIENGQREQKMSIRRMQSIPGAALFGSWEPGTRFNVEIEDQPTKHGYGIRQIVSADDSALDLKPDVPAIL